MSKNEILNKKEKFSVENIDFTSRSFFRIMKTISFGPLDIIEKWMFENDSKDIKSDFRNEWDKWNNLSDEEQYNLLNNCSNDYIERIEKFWNKNEQIINLHRTYLGEPTYKWKMDKSENKISKSEFYKKFRVLASDWKEFLKKNKNIILNTFRTIISEFANAAYVNLFTFVGFTILGESVLNTLNILFKKKIKCNTLITCLSEVLEFIIKRENEVIDDFLKLPSDISYEDFIIAIEDNTASYRHISINQNKELPSLDRESNFKIINKIKLDNSSEFGELISEFKIIAERVLVLNSEYIEKVEIRELSLLGNSVLENFINEFEEKLIKRIKEIKDFILSNRNEIVNLFLEGEDWELTLMGEWLNKNFNKSIISGFFFLRNAFAPKHREEIINNAIDAAIIHNEDLLTLKDGNLISWLIYGLKED